ncbi:MAG: hypothetical protein OEV92_05765 [Nitrospinota bacterium]|nr:hypothetical protein [Nitrospinota bacterium]
MRNAFGFLAWMLYFAVLIHAPGAWAAVIGVTSSADTVAVDTFCSLREAVNNANSVGADTTSGDCSAATGGDTISIPAGTYTLTGASGDDANLSGDLDIWQSVTITGAGAGTTIIDGNGAATGDRVIHVRANIVPWSLTVVGVTITGGMGSLGAGIYSPGPVTVTNSTISGNSSTTGNGGGIFCSDVLTVTNSTISGNSGFRCGGIYSGGALTVTSSTISGNSATDSYGGILSLGAATITSSTITGNSAAVNSGGIYSGGALTVTNSTISGNAAKTGNSGGIYANAGGSITNSTISGNSAATWGGGVNNYSLGLTINNSTVASNSAANGGGMFSFLAGSNITLGNTIVAGNTGANCASSGGGIPPISFGNNIASDNTCNLILATDLSNNALITGSLGALANNGGATQTHALLAGSPAIDKGSGCGATDQRGVSRPRDGNADKLARCDIGAYEYAANTASTLSMTISGTGTVSDGIGATSLMNACSPGPCTETYDSAATISLTATPTAPAFFFGWSGSVTGTANPISLAMSANKTLTATFGAEGLVVTVTGPGTVAGASAVGPAIDCPTINCGAVVTPGTLYNMTATPTGAAVFTGWTITNAEPLGTTCAGALTTCNVATSMTPGSVTYATARFDLPGCTSATATNYNPSATINDGSCTFPASGGGGGGGLDNQPPYYPGGGPWLISPENKANGDGNTPFVWRKLTDLDGDTVTYNLYACSGADFADCKVIDMVVGNGDQNHRYAYGMGASGAALLLIGFGFTLSGRRRLLVAIAALALTSSAVLIACGASDSGNGVTVTSCSAASADELCVERLNLAAGDYQWKVTADDSRGGQTDSESRAFTVK